MPFSPTLGVQSFCFRGFKDNAKVAQLVKEIGASQIELCGIHVDFNDESAFDPVIKTYQDAGVGICAIGVERIGTDEAAARKRFNFCKKAGAKAMSVTFKPEDTPDCYRLAEKLADEYDIRLGIHNHGGYDWLGSTTMLSHVFKNTSKRIGLYLDTAWALQAGEDPLKYVEQFGDRLYGIHIKDFVFQPTGKVRDVVVGTGNLDLAKLAQLLTSAKFTGPTVLEYEGDIDNPTPALTQCIEAIKKTA